MVGEVAAVPRRSRGNGDNSPAQQANKANPRRLRGEKSPAAFERYGVLALNIFQNLLTVKKPTVKRAKKRGRDKSLPSKSNHIKSLCVEQKKGDNKTDVNIEYKNLNINYIITHFFGFVNICKATFYILYTCTNFVQIFIQNVLQIRSYTDCNIHRKP